MYEVDSEWGAVEYSDNGNTKLSLSMILSYQLYYSYGNHTDNN